MKEIQKSQIAEKYAPIFGMESCVQCTRRGYFGQYGKIISCLVLPDAELPVPPLFVEKSSHI